MKQFIAFIKKESLEQLRTGKLLILGIIFCLFGIMNPAITKLLPWMMELMSEQLAENGMLVVNMEVDALTSWTQFFKNMEIALIIYIIMFSGILTNEYQKNTLINMITKGLKRYKILISKMVIMTVLWTLGCFISYGITYGYNAYFWDNSIAHNLLFATFCFYLLGLWLISGIVLASTFFKSTSAVTLCVGIAFLVVYLLGLIPKIKSYLPPYLLGSAGLLTGTANTSAYYMGIGVTLVLIVTNIMLGVILFNRKNI